MISNQADESGDSADVIFEHEFDRESSVGVSIVEAIAGAEGVTPIELEFTLYDYVNPDALDALFDDHRALGDPGVDLTIGRHQVRIENDGRILVSESDL